MLRTYHSKKGVTEIVTPCKMVPPRRFERLTYGLGIRCSILLSYGGLFIYKELPKPFFQPVSNLCQLSLISGYSTYFLRFVKRTILYQPLNKFKHFEHISHAFVVMRISPSYFFWIMPQQGLFPIPRNVRFG